MSKEELYQNFGQGQLYEQSLEEILNRGITTFLKKLKELYNIS